MRVEYPGWKGGYLQRKNGGKGNKREDPFSLLYLIVQKSWCCCKLGFNFIKGENCFENCSPKKIQGGEKNLLLD
jgi:hypothetical protein